MSNPVLKTESDYIQAEHDLAFALGLKPCRFTKDASYQRTIVAGVWATRSNEIAKKYGPFIPPWARDDGAAFALMTTYKCMPSGSFDDEIFIQWGIDLENVWEPVNQHSSFRAAVRYAVVKAVTLYLTAYPEKIGNLFDAYPDDGRPEKNKK